MATQRKIHHLLQSEGEEATFRYLPALRVPFDLNKPVLVTEKVDGSTMQSMHGEPWKRFDRFSKGNPRKRLVSEDERYELRLCKSDDPSVKWYLASFNAYREQFEKFGKRYPDRWIYFEALNGKIGARYKGLDPIVRIFDISENGRFLPFLDAASVASEVGLPVVVHRQEVFGFLDNLLEILASDFSRDSGFPKHNLEGWVLRQYVVTHASSGEVVAKIRVEDLKKIAR